MKKKIIQTIEPVEIRLNKFIANAGICSRRDADKLILSGKISVNLHEGSAGEYVEFKDKRVVSFQSPHQSK